MAYGSDESACLALAIAWCKLLRADRDEVAATIAEIGLATFGEELWTLSQSRANHRF
ncbi:hypothetical protein LTR95_002905 [Oleoguttula sp. CCFEE 5521]